MADEPGRRQAVKCGGCGRTLFERSGGLAWREYRVHGRKVKDVFLLSVRHDCHGCGRPWLNPDMVAYDGVGAAVQEGIEAGRQLAEDPRRIFGARVPRERGRRDGRSDADAAG